jgi:hypothetical protein
LVIATFRNRTFTEAIMKTIKRSQLNGVTGWLSIDGVLRICSMKTRWHRDGFCLDTCHTDDECKCCGDTPLTGDPLIAALRERGVEVIDDAQPAKPALGGPDDEYARKWADENGYEVEYRLPKKGEQYIEYLGTPNQCVLASPIDFNYVRCYILTPKATQPALGGPDDEAARKWAEERGYQIVAYRLPRNQEYYIANGDLHKVAAWHIDQAMSDWVTETRYILTPKATQPALGGPDDEADHLRKELDEAWATIDELNGKLDAIEQPPMSDERFRQEAAIAAMASLNQHADVVELAEKIVASGSPITVRQMIAGKAIEYADALLSAMKGGAA